MKKIDNRVSLRFEDSDLKYYKSRANEKGVSLSDYLKKAIVEGHIAESAEEISLRMTELSEAHFEAKTLLGSEGRDALFLSVFKAEALLTKIVNDRDPSRIIEAENEAKAMLIKFKEMTND